MLVCEAEGRTVETGEAATWLGALAALLEDLFGPAPVSGDSQAL